VAIPAKPLSILSFIIIMTNLTFKRILKFCNPVLVTKNLVWRYLSRKSYEPHVFVLGAPRSGTTLMFRILFVHPEFYGLDYETFFFVPRNLFNDDKKCQLNNNFQSFSVEEIIQVRNQSRDIIHFYDNLAKLIAPREGGQHFLEKTPPHVLYLRFLIKKLPNAKFIHMIRDGRDCYVSHKRLGPQSQWSITDFAKMWRDHILARQRVGEHHQIIDIKYEEFVQEPLETTKKIMNFLGEDFFDQQIDPKYYSNTNRVENPGHERLKQPITSASVGSWREKMTAKEIAIFNRIAGSKLQELGYDVSTTHPFLKQV